MVVWAADGASTSPASRKAACRRGAACYACDSERLAKGLSRRRRIAECPLVGQGVQNRERSGYTLNLWRRYRTTLREWAPRRFFRSALPTRALPSLPFPPYPGRIRVRRVRLGLRAP